MSFRRRQAKRDPPSIRENFAREISNVAYFMLYIIATLCLRSITSLYVLQCISNERTSNNPAGKISFLSIYPTNGYNS